MIARDLYFRRNGGPVIHVRVWDAELFAATERERGWKPDKPADRYTVAFVDAEEYAAERRTHRRR